MIFTLPYFINSLEFITIIIGFIFYDRYKHTALKYFLWFLIYGFLTEILGLFIGFNMKLPNHVIFNIYAVVYYLFFFWLFNTYLKNKKYKTVVKLFTLGFLLVVLVNNIFYENIFSHYQPYIWLYGNIALIITIILFFTEVFNSDIILKLKSYQIFWVAVGVFIFQIGFLPVFVATKYINNSNGLTYGYILLFLNLVTSICFSLSFIWTKKN